MTGKIRIIAGQWRGRKIVVPDRPGLRPTSDRARETLFNWIGPGIVGAQVADLFAGSGALGLEAASRGAGQVTLIERDPAAVQALRDGPLQWPGGGNTKLVEADALAWLGGQEEPFDLILIDPPFESALLDEVLARLAERPQYLSGRGLVYVECSPSQCPEIWPAALEVRKQKRLGQVVLTLLHRSV